MTFSAAHIRNVDDAATNNTTIGLGTWRTPSSNRPAFIHVEARLDPGSTNAAIIDLDVDESGGTTADYSHRMRVPGGLRSSDRTRSAALPPGASFQLNNVQDPDGNNAFHTLRELIL